MFFSKRKRNGLAVKRFFKRLFRAHTREPRKIVTDKLGGYGVAHRELMPEPVHDTYQFSVGETFIG